MRPRFDAGVLALVDASSSSANAAWRAALVARDHAAPLRLLCTGAVGAAEDLAAAIRERLRLKVETRVLASDSRNAIVQAAREAGLLVLGARRGNLLREFILGTQAEWLIRLCRVPVLVVKRPPLGSYRRVLVPVDVAPGARRILAAAQSLSRDPRMEVLHALPLHEERAMRSVELPEVVVRHQRNRAVQRARSFLSEHMAAIGAVEALPAVTFGDPAAAVLARERAIRAELVVIGKRQRGLLAGFFLGGVTQRVLAAARADVFVMPEAGGGDVGVRVAQPDLRRV